MLLAHNKFESQLWLQDKKYILGIDEVGRGCWAGPLVIGAVMFPQDATLDFPLADSKLLSEKKRLNLDEKIKSSALAYTIVEVPLDEINTKGVGQAAQTGFLTAVQKITPKVDHVLIDAFKIKNYPLDKQTPIIKGDQQSISIAAASIIAKNYRDQLMRNIHPEVPHYNFQKNVGYGTAEHRNAIAKHGLCQYHRISYDLQKWLPGNTSSS
jgi:ribonuclease HII